MTNHSLCGVASLGADLDLRQNFALRSEDVALVAEATAAHFTASDVPFLAVKQT